MDASLEGKICSCGKVTSAVIVTNEGRMQDTNKEYILITKHSCPEMAPALFGAVGIITEEGGLVSHLAVVARELRIPCITGCKGVMDYFKNDEIAILDASYGIGKIGKVYKNDR